MAKIIPFNGLRYNTDIVGDLSAVTTPPYDIISPKQQQAYYDAHPFNVIRLELGKEMPDDDETNNKYTRSGQYLNEWLESGVLKQDDSPSMYIYGQDFELKDGRKLSYKGIMCLVKLEEFEKKIILPHEETLSKAKTDRYNLMNATGANFSSIYSLYMDESGEISNILNGCTKNSPENMFTSTDGVVQKLWRIADDDIIHTLEKAFENKQLFIADGHHRYETALNFRNAMREKNPDYTGNELYNYVMMFLVDLDEKGLVVFPTHRLLKNLSNFDEDDVVSKLSKDFEVEKAAVTTDAAAEIEHKLADMSADKVFAMYTGKDYYYTIKLKNFESVKEANPDKSDAYRNLDVTVLHSLILNKIFGIDMENMKNQMNLVYTRDPKEAEQAVKSKEFQCAFFLNPTKIHEIKDVSLANEKMPQKSTYFYPKLITGLIMNKFQ